MTVQIKKSYLIGKKGERMKKLIFKRSILFNLIITFVLITTFAFAQTAEQIPKTQEEIEKEKRLREKIEKEAPKVEIEEKIPAALLAPKAEEAKVFIKSITVTGVSFLSEQEVRKIVSNFENQELNLAQMQKVADLITDAYRKKGYITSRAYLPPQKIETGILEVRVLEGITGDIEVKGNRYFKKSIYLKKILLKKGSPFDYNILKKGVSKINASKDRNVRTILAPGKEPGKTDIVLEAKERLPLHIGFDFDNFGSRYIENDRYTLSFTHNNLLGLDDKLSFQYQLAQSKRYFLKNVRYLLPLTNTLELGAFLSFSRVKLGKEYKDLDTRGKSRIYGLFLNKSLLDEENITLGFNIGFDYKDARNYQNQVLTSEDRIRVLKLGADLDILDSFGRSLFSPEIDFGIPNIMGGLREQDPKSSRSGAGGKFIKTNLNIIRLQKMPFSSTILWKNQIQISPYILPSTEEFQIGGITNNRGYPPAEVVGDKGYASTLEWSFPFYPLPKQIKVPLSETKLYDALRVIIFYDWATARLRRPIGTEEKRRTLRSLGCGLRFNLAEDFSLRIETGWPLDNSPSDSDHAHTWIEVSKQF